LLTSRQVNVECNHGDIGYQRSEQHHPATSGAMANIFERTQINLPLWTVFEEVPAEFDSAVEFVEGTLW